MPLVAPKRAEAERNGFPKGRHPANPSRSRRASEWCGCSELGRAPVKWKRSDLRMKSSVTGGDLTSIPPMLNVEGLSYFAGLQSLEKLFRMVFQGYPETLMTSLDLWRLRPALGQRTPVTWQRYFTGQSPICALRVPSKWTEVSMDAGQAAVEARGVMDIRDYAARHLPPGQEGQYPSAASRPITRQADSASRFARCIGRSASCRIHVLHS